MSKSVIPGIFLNVASERGHVIRSLVSTVLLSSLVACAAAPAKPVVSGPTKEVVSQTGLTAAADMYNSGDYPAAIEEFGKIISDQSSSANNRRMANLGKAMVYLGNDPNWHSIANAKMSLISAGQVAPEGDEEFPIETNLLMDAITNVIGSESKYIALKEKTGGSGGQLAKLKQENTELESERDQLIAEQRVLNEALEKLKQLTLGN